MSNPPPANYRPLNVRDALSYLDQVKVSFGAEPRVGQQTASRERRDSTPPELASLLLVPAVFLVLLLLWMVVISLLPQSYPS
jgi:hypothetical protein